MRVALYLIAFLWLFWVLYVFTMGMYRAKLQGRLTKPALVLGYPFVVLAVVADMLCNVTLAALLFREWPRELLVTKRLQRYLAGPDGWRKDRARWICQSLLDPLDARDRHC